MYVLQYVRYYIYIRLYYMIFFVYNIEQGDVKWCPAKLYIDILSGADYKKAYLFLP